MWEVHDQGMGDNHFHNHDHDGEHGNDHGDDKGHSHGGKTHTHDHEHNDKPKATHTCTKYTHVKGCVSGNNINKFKNKSIAECREICDKISKCKGFEFFVPSGKPGAAKMYQKGDCQPQSGDNTFGCDYKHWQMQFWKKHQFKCNPNETEEYFDKYVEKKEKENKPKPVYSLSDYDLLYDFEHDLGICHDYKETK